MATARAAAAAKTSKRTATKETSSLADFCRPCPRDKKRRKGANTSRQITAAATPAPRDKDPVVQVINGELVLQQQHETANGNDDERSMTVVVEEQAATTGIVGAGYTDFTVKRAGSGSRWTAEETDMFYTALRQIGLDFGTMEAYFEGRRNRRQLKRKYYSELKRHGDLIEKAMHPAARVKIDLEVFELTEETVKENIAEVEKKREEEEKKREEEEKAKADEAADKLDDEEKQESEEVVEENGTAAAEGSKTITNAIVSMDTVIDEFTDPTSNHPIMDDDVDDDMNEEFMGTEGTMLHEETEDRNDVAQEPPTLSLVHVEPDKPKSTKAKPRFKSRKIKK
jgi:hypothetical protein